MPPPCEVSFEVDRADGEVWLDAAAGVDLSVARSLLRDFGPRSSARVSFEVLVNDQGVGLKVSRQFTQQVITA